MRLEYSGEYQLMNAVINQAVEDYLDPTLEDSLRDEARRFLKGTSSDPYFEYIAIEKHLVLKALGLL
jgi:hypothetical protein